MADDSIGGKADLFCAWIASNGRSEFKTPQRLYHPGWDYDDGSSTLWQRGGNHSHPTGVLGFLPYEFGGFSYASESEAKVQLVINTAEAVLASIARSWGLVDEREVSE